MVQQKHLHGLRATVLFDDVRGRFGPKLEIHFTEYFITDKIPTQTLA